MSLKRGTGMPMYRLDQRVNKAWSWLLDTLFPSESVDYIKWRHEFLYKRLKFGLWIGLICFFISSTHGLYIFLFEIDQLRIDFEKFYEEPFLANQLRSVTLIGFFVINGLLLFCLLIHRTNWGRRHPATIFIIFSCATNGFTTQLISTFYGIPIPPSAIVFLAFAVLLPLRWPLHLFSQLLPISYYAIVLPLLGITEVGNTSIFDSIYSLGTFIEIGWVCLICNVAVLVYEQLRRSEFESRRELQIFLHAISHDLRNPVIGTSMVVKNLLDKTVDNQVMVRKPVLERLLQGSDRQLGLINSLVEAYHADGQNMPLHFQPLQISTVVDGVLADVEPKLIQNRIKLQNFIHSDLPLINADKTHLWRVFNNLIDNALKHNPPGIQLILDAEVSSASQGLSRKFGRDCLNLRSLSEKISQPAPRTQLIPVLLCFIRDNGIGIPETQFHSLFELYARGRQARYMPGLGLGLYLCKQIITAHGGEIGVISQPDVGSAFWFTLPLVDSAPSPDKKQLVINSR